MQCSKRPVNLGAFGQALGLLTNYNLAPADEKDPRMTALRRRGKLCYGSFLKIHPRFQSAAALRAADSGDDDDRGGRRLWIRSDAPFWPRAPRRPRWPQRRACLRSSRHKEELPCASMKKAPSASNEEAGSGFPLLLIAGGGL